MKKFFAFVLFFGISLLLFTVKVRADSYAIAYTWTGSLGYRIFKFDNDNVYNGSVLYQPDPYDPGTTVAYLRAPYDIYSVTVSDRIFSSPEEAYTAYVNGFNSWTSSHNRIYQPYTFILLSNPDSYSFVFQNGNSNQFSSWQEYENYINPPTPTPTPTPLPSLQQTWWEDWLDGWVSEDSALYDIGNWFSNIIDGSHGGGHDFGLPSGYPSPTPTPEPTSTPIPYSTVINPTTGQVEYHWNDPTSGPTMSLQPPTNSPGPGSGNGSGAFPTPPYETTNYYYPEDPLAIPGDSPEIPPVQMGSGTISMRDLPDVYEDIDNNLEEYSDGINAASDTFAVFPTKWILAIGTICCITIIASAVSRLLH